MKIRLDSPATGGPRLSTKGLQQVNPSETEKLEPREPNVRHRKRLVVGGLVFMVVAGIGGFLWQLSLQPFYEPGMVRREHNLRGPLRPPELVSPGDEDTWQVEKDIRLHHWSVGSGNPVLVVHGGPGYPFTTLPDGLGELTDRYEFHFYDQRGCGQSTRPFDRFESGGFYANMVELERTLGLGAQIADLERIRQILNLEQLTIIGHSFGAFLATMYAAEFPDRVGAMVLVAPAGVLVLPAPESDLFAIVRTRLPANQVDEFDTFMEEYLAFGQLFSRSEQELAAMNRKIGQYFLEATRDGAAHDGTEIPADNGGWMVQAAYLSMGRQHDYRPALQQITAPTLVLHGAEDIVPQQVSSTYAEGIPGAKMVVLQPDGTLGGQGTGHFPWSSNPGEFGKTIGDFLDSVEQGKPQATPEHEQGRADNQPVGETTNGR